MLLPLSSQADIYVIVNKDNPINKISNKQTIDIFMGKKKRFVHGEQSFPIDQPDKSNTKAEFYKLLTGKSVAYVNAYWARLFYTGRNTPPADNFKSTKAILDEVSTNSEAIAYVKKQDLPDTIKVVLTLYYPKK